MGEDVAAQSPLAGGDAHRFRRGLVTHRLLQTLPDLPEDRRESAAAFFAAQPVHALPEDVQQSIVREVLAVLNHPDYAPLFGPESRAELPVTGMAGDTLVSGQIDRLAVMNDEVWIVDYKTNRPPPDDEGGIPEVYRRQLAAYAGVLAGLWPGRAIRTFLLWTDGARLMEVKAVKAFSLTNGPNSP